MAPHYWKGLEGTDDTTDPLLEGFRRVEKMVETHYWKGLEGDECLRFPLLEGFRRSMAAKKTIIGRV